MFSPEDLQSCLGYSWFVRGYALAEQSILCDRLGLKPIFIEITKQTALLRFSQAVLGSAPYWTDSRSGLARQLCLAAADIEAGLGLSDTSRDGKIAYKKLLKASILYDLGGMPGSSASIAKRAMLDSRLYQYFSRAKESLWATLISPPERVYQFLGSEIDKLELQSIYADELSDRNSPELIRLAIAESVVDIGRALQLNTRAESAEKFLFTLAKAVGTVSLDIEGDDVAALLKTALLRRKSSSLSFFSDKYRLSNSALRAIEAPAEFWPVQVKALDGGLLGPNVNSFGLAAPTGTGKTALTRVLIAEFMENNPDKKVLYVCPSRALVSQVGRDLKKSLSSLGISVAAVGAQLTVHEHFSDPTDCHTLVFTPEKADLLLRIQPNFIQSVGLVIVDEAHHIEQGARGILLEFYLWRLRKTVPLSSRFVQLSAVTPNISELVSWLGEGGDNRSIKVDWRTSRLRLAQFERTDDGGAVIEFSEQAPISLFGADQFPLDDFEGIAALAERLSLSGIVLVLATSTAKAELIAAEISKFRETDIRTDDRIDSRFDAIVERELFSESPLRALYKKRIAFHHAQLPPRVRIVIEEAISERKIDIVVATTTLAEGVNFPFSTVIVESLLGKGYELSPRSLWNIAGRAGRFGVDSEGHCILFCPSKWQHKLKHFKLNDYLSTKLDEIPPVRSALATAFSDLKKVVDNDEIRLEMLDRISLGDIIKEKRGKANLKSIRGLVNILRVGFVHAESTGVISHSNDDATELGIEFLASNQMDETLAKFAQGIGERQKKVIHNNFRNKEHLLGIAARIGWSLETQNDMYEWVQELEEWKLKAFGNCVAGGRILNHDKLKFILWPFSDRMSEFEGDKLGGFTAFISIKWLEGLPLTAIRNAQKEKPEFGRLVRVIYARVQYLLPWGLFGLHELVSYEARRRGIRIGSGLKDLSALAAEGVPNFDALTLILQLGVERVDATRLSREYHKLMTGTDIVGWLKGLPWEEVENIVRSSDRRRLDPDLQFIWQGIQ